MNKIYSLKYSVIYDAIIPVPEFCQRRTKSAAGKLISGVLLTTACLFPFMVNAGTVGDDIPYQTYRDFAENKGRFTAGATNIPIYNKDGTIKGWLDKAPMPDFSSVDTDLSVTSLIYPQYSVSVKHNCCGGEISFGGKKNKYTVVQSNNQPAGVDFTLARYNKLITEATPIPASAEVAGTNTYLNKERYPVFYRLGTGAQNIQDKNDKIIGIAPGGSYLTGGTMVAPATSNTHEIEFYSSTVQQLAVSSVYS